MQDNFTQVVPINDLNSTVSKGQTFSITLSEVPCSNCKWLTTFPSNIVLVDKHHQTGIEPYRMMWTLVCDIPGVYVLEFTYRKQCCGKPKLKQATYTITIQ